jgi:flagellar biosynthesis/type III secretory pathway protein FliH
MPTKKAPAVEVKQAPMTSTERTQAMRERLRRLGFAKLDLYVHPEDRDAVRAYANKLRARRERTSRSEVTA